MRARVLVLLALALPAHAQENPLAPGGQPLPVRASPAPAACGGFVDPERELILGLWEATGGGLEGELRIGQRGYPVRLAKGSQPDEWSGTFKVEAGSLPLSVQSASGKLLLRSGQVEYTLVRCISAAQLDQARVQQERPSKRQAYAAGALRTLITSEELFREGDKEGDGNLDYASSLQELARVGLIDPELGSGTAHGYRFELRGNDAVWAATANPLGQPGDKAFFVNQEGIVYYTTRGPITLPEDCKLPRGLTPVGMEEGTHDQDELDAIMAAGEEAVHAYESSRGATTDRALELARAKLRDVIGRLKAFLARPQYRVDGQLRQEFIRNEVHQDYWERLLADLERPTRVNDR